jgi:hypothetical protein
VIIQLRHCLGQDAYSFLVVKNIHFLQLLVAYNRGLYANYAPSQLLWNGPRGVGYSWEIDYEYNVFTGRDQKLQSYFEITEYSYNEPFSDQLQYHTAKTHLGNLYIEVHIVRLGIRMIEPEELDHLDLIMSLRGITCGVLVASV